MPHQTSIKVRGYHLDLYCHVNNARYLEFLEEARWTFFEDRADLPAFLASGIALIVVNINIDYRHPATMNDELVIETSVKSVGNRSSVLHQSVRLAGSDKIAASADVTLVAYNGRQQKAIPIEGQLRELLETLQHQA
ncbi:acyl-CoA thioesterase [Vogesella amnigena]|uniref:Acyl-CoA thioesterase n=1 Tax=Vogesella amnigena TaxID=1507449 RepID=A0ABV7TUT4_9NEIS